MKNGQDHLAVRRHSRLECRLPASVRVSDQHSAQLVFSRAVAESGGGIPARIVDCSKGGLGLHTGVYLPRGVHLAVLFALPGPAGGVEHEIGLRVQRSSLVGRDPTYYLGTSIIEHPGAVESLSLLLSSIEQAAAGEGAA